MGNKKNLLYTAFIVVFASLTISLLYFSLFNPFFQDEGVFLTIADGILKGKIPYRDFFDHKPPGIYFLLAPVFAIFGKNVWALKTFLFFNNFAAAFLVYKITNLLFATPDGSHSTPLGWKRPSTPTRGRCRREIHIPGILAALLYLFTATFFEANYLVAEPFMATFLLAGLYIYIKTNNDVIPIEERNLIDSSSQAPQNDNQKKGIFLCGIMIGLATLMKQTAIINFFILGYFIWRDSFSQNKGDNWIPHPRLNEHQFGQEVRNDKKESVIPAQAGIQKIGSSRWSLSRAKSRDSNNKILPYLFGAILPWIPIIIYLFANRALKEDFNQMVVVNFTSYPREPLMEVLQYVSGTFKQTLPVWILFLAYIAFSVIPHLMRNPENPQLDSCFRRNDRKEDSGLALFARMTQGRAVNLILAFIFIPIPLLLVRHYPHYWLQIVPFVSIFAGIALYKLLVDYVILRQEPKNFKSQPTRFFTPFRMTKELLLIPPFLFLILYSLFSNLRWYQWMTNNQNVPKLREQMEAARFITTLPQKNMLAENQFTAFYFLTGKEPPTKYLYITEVNHSENAEEITIDKLKQNPNTIILWPKDKEYAYAKELQQYILENYEPIKEYDSLELLTLSQNPRQK